MKKKRGLFSKIYSITILMMLFTTALAGMQVMASTDDQESQVNKVHWKSNTKDEEIEIPEGVTGDGGKWESPTYTSSDDEIKSTSIETKPMSAGAEYAAIIAGLIGVLAISAAKKSSSESVPTVSEGNGIWVPESDRDAVIKMINKAASKEYYIDANGFVKEVIGAVEDPCKSSTYSSVIDRLIAGNNKVVIGVGDGWVSSGENGLEANAFTGDNSGITIGDNGTPQVVVVSGEDMPNSSADITLAHELIHALRGEEGIKSINTTGVINQDEEAHTIELENNIREELGYVARTDGDISDGGDGSYGKYSDASEEDWYNKIDEMQGSDTLSGNAYSNWYAYAAPGSNFSPAHPDAPHIIVYDDIDDLGDALSNESGGDDDDDCDCDCDCDCQWGDNYDDSIWSKGGSVSVVNNVVTGTVGWRSFSVPKRNWNTFFRSNTDTKKTLSGINTSIGKYSSKVLGPRNLSEISVADYFKTSNVIMDKNGVFQNDGWNQQTNGAAAWYTLHANDNSEHVVISGNNDGNHAARNFIETAIKQIKDWKSEGNENITWVVTNSGYTEKDIERMKEIAKDNDASIMFIDNADELYNYINTGTDVDGNTIKNRITNKITDVSIFSHGTKDNGGTLALNYDDKNGYADSNLNISIDDLNNANLNKDAFSNVHTFFGACNAGTVQNGTSFANEWVKNTGGEAEAICDPTPETDGGQTTYEHINDGNGLLWKSADWVGREKLGINFDEAGCNNYPIKGESTYNQDLYWTRTLENGSIEIIDQGGPKN